MHHLHLISHEGACRVSTCWRSAVWTSFDFPFCLVHFLPYSSFLSHLSARWGPPAYGCSLRQGSRIYRLLTTPTEEDINDDIFEWAFQFIEGWRIASALAVSHMKGILRHDETGLFLVPNGCSQGR